MNDKLHTVSFSVEIASFEKSDLPEVDEQLVEDVSGFFLERFENVTVRVTTNNRQDTSRNKPERKEK